MFPNSKFSFFSSFLVCFMWLRLPPCWRANLRRVILSFDITKAQSVSAITHNQTMEMLYGIYVNDPVRLVTQVAASFKVNVITAPGLSTWIFHWNSRWINNQRSLFWNHCDFWVPATVDLNVGWYSKRWRDIGPARIFEIETFSTVDSQSCQTHAVGCACIGVKPKQSHWNMHISMRMF